MVVAGARQAKALASSISLFGLALLLSACAPPIQISPAQAQAAPGTSLQLTATQIDYFGTSRDVTSQVAWSSSDSAVATVSSLGGTRGIVSAVSGGNTLITASLGGAKGSMKFTVTSAVLKSIEVTPAAPSLPNGLTEQFTATGIYSDNSTQDLTQQLTWTSSSPAVATISNAGGASGLAKAVSVGRTTISASKGTITGSTTLTVTSATLVSIEVTPATVSIPKGVSRQFTATGIFSDNTTQNLTTQVTWASSNTGIATLSNVSGSQGRASASAVGSTTISAAIGSISGSTSLTVTSATLVSIAVTPPTPSIADGLSEQFTAIGTYTDNSTQNLTTQVIWASSDTGIGAISNAAGSQGLASALAVGSTIISAASGSISGSTTLTVTSASLVSIAITPASPSIANGLAERFTAIGTYTDNSTQNLTRQVTWASSDNNVATISNAAGSQGLASSASAGSTSISATSGSISGSTTLTVTSAMLVSIAVTPADPTIANGLSERFTATGTYTDNSTQDLTTQVTWASSNNSIATISNAGGSQGLASSAAAGSTTISATSGSISGSTTLTVTSATLVSIAVTPANPAIADGRSEQFTAIGTYTDNSTQNLTTQVTWASSDTNVATVSSAGGSRGLASSAAVGSTTISATSGSISGSTSLTVSSATLVSIAVTPAAPSIADGLSEQFTATGNFTDNSTQDLTAQVTWASTDTSVATVSNAGGSHGLASSATAGSTTISATSGAISGSTTLTVTSATLVSIAVTPANPSIANGLSEQFTAIGTYTDNSTQNITTQVSWASSNTGVATISNAGGSKGLASSAASGITTISATSGGISGSTSLTVTSASLVSISVTPATPSIADGLSEQFTAIGTYTDNSTQNLTTQVNWASSDSSVATVSNAGGSQGLASSAAAGSTIISATSGAVSGSTTLTVTSASLVSITVTPANPTIAKGLTEQFTAIGTYTDNSTQNLTTQVSWASSNTSVSTISNAAGSQGLASSAAAGNTTISATSGAISGSTTLTVTSATLVSISLTPANPSIADGLSEQFTAVGTYTDNSTQNLTTQVTWSSNNTGVATISNAGGSQGLASSATAGSATISATSGAVSGSTTLTVTSATLVSISVTPASPSIAKGLSEQFTATGTYTDNSNQDLTTQVTWSSGTTAVATISNAAGSQGLASSGAAGSTTISATSGAVSGSTTLNVTSATLVSISLTPANPSIADGLSEPFTATGTYTDNSTQNITAQVTWASSNTGVATISNAAGSQGLARSAAAGSTNISATSGAISGSTTLTVTSATLVSISLTPANPSIADGLSEQFTAIGTYTDNSTQNLTSQVTWASSNTGVATISNAGGSQGLANSAAAGSTTISATSGAISGSTTLTVTSATLVSISLTPANPSIADGLSEQFTAIGTYTDNSTQNLTTQVTWASSNAGVATISNAAGSQGLASSATAGSTTISATSGSIAGSTTLTVTAASLVSIAVTPANPTIAKGLAQQFAAVGTYTDNSIQNITTQVTWNSSNTGVATISNGAGSQGLASSAAAGSATISATSGAISGSTTLTVTAASLVSIAVTPANPSIAKGLTEQFTATGTYTDNSTQNLTTQVSWGSSNTSVSTISNAAGSQGLASAATAGSTTIAATSGSISGSTTLTVTSATLVSIAVTPANPSVAKGLTEQFTATGTYTDNSTQNLTSQVTWASSNTGVATISNAGGSQGLASSAAAGSATISATSGAISGSTTLTVTSATLVSIAVTPANPSIAKGLTEQFTATGTYTDNSTQNLTTQVSWGSTNTSVSTISNAAGSQGLASSASAGSTTISATSGSVAGSTTLTVTAATLVSIAVTPANPGIAKGLTEQFTATGTYTDNSTQNVTAQLNWSSSNTSVSTISNAAGSQGLASSVAGGSTTISAASGSISGSTTLTVTSATLVSIAVTPANPSIAKGLTEQFTATGTYTDNSTQNLTSQVTWASSNTGVATISNAAGSQGFASSATAGSTTVSATSGAIVGSTTLTVTAATLVSIAVTPATPSIANGLSEQFTATGTYTDNSTQNVTAQVNWASSNTGIATISNAAGSQGLASSAATGSTTISATSGAISGSTTLTVTSATLVSIAVTPANPSIAKGLTEQFTATGTYTDNSTQNVTAQVTWVSSNTGVATISNAAGSQGLASSAATGSTTISATSGGISGTTTLTVTSATLVSIAVTPANPNIAKGLTEQFTATGTYTDNSTQNLTTKVTWASGTTAVATISNAGGSQGLASSAATGSTTISATSGSISGSTTLTVTSATLVSIAVTPANPSIVNGLTQQFTATGTYTDTSTQNLTTQVTWASSSTSIATISNAGGSQGLASSAAAGSTTISAASGSISGSTTLTVIPAMYSIGGSISGLSTNGLALTDNGGNTLSVNSGATSFTFSTQLASGTTYAVAVSTQPTGQICTVSNGSGTVTGTVTSVSVSCVVSYTLGGTISGLNVSSVVLANAGTTVTVSSGSSTWSFASSFVTGSSYAVTVQTQPAGETCQVTSGGSGTLTANVNNVTVVCALGLWTWDGGPSSVGASGVYGTKGTASASNIPPGRQNSVNWVDSSGNLWLFGGSNSNYYNDLWEYSPSSGEWTWVGGSSSVNVAGVYGTQGTAAASNLPGARQRAASWIDSSGNLWLFGGYGYGASGSASYLNDLWKYSPSSGEWTWVSGSNSTGASGTFGTKGTASASNVPPANMGPAAYWIDSSNNLWLFGGTNGSGSMNALWEYSPSSGEWTWVSGSSSHNANGVYGTEGIVSSTNVPGARFLSAFGIDSSGNVWMFGGKRLWRFGGHGLVE